MEFKFNRTFGTWAMFFYFPVIYSLQTHTHKKKRSTYKKEKEKKEAVQNRNQKQYSDYDVALLTAYQAIKQKYKEILKIHNMVVIITRNYKMGNSSKKKLLNGYDLFLQ